MLTSLQASLERFSNWCWSDDTISLYLKPSRSETELKASIWKLEDLSEFYLVIDNVWRDEALHVQSILPNGWNNWFYPRAHSASYRVIIHVWTFNSVQLWKVKHSGLVLGIISCSKIKSKFTQPNFGLISWWNRIFELLVIDTTITVLRLTHL